METNVSNVKAEEHANNCKTIKQKVSTYNKTSNCSRFNSDLWITLLRFFMATVFYGIIGYSAILAVIKQYSPKFQL